MGLTATVAVLRSFKTNLNFLRENFFGQNNNKQSDGYRKGVRFRWTDSGKNFLLSCWKALKLNQNLRLANETSTRTSSMICEHVPWKKRGVIWDVTCTKSGGILLKMTGFLSCDQIKEKKVLEMKNYQHSLVLSRSCYRLADTTSFGVSWYTKSEHLESQTQVSSLVLIFFFILNW